MARSSAVAYTPADQAGRDWVEAQLRELGLAVARDAAGNTIGVYAGAADLPPLALGSHTDTVPNGGATTARWAWWRRWPASGRCARPAGGCATRSR